jgi:hypothetical protein
VPDGDKNRLSNSQAVHFISETASFFCCQYSANLRETKKLCISNIDSLLSSNLARKAFTETG